MYTVSRNFCEIFLINGNKFELMEKVEQVAKKCYNWIQISFFGVAGGFKELTVLFEIIKIVIMYIDLFALCYICEEKINEQAFRIKIFNTTDLDLK